MRHVIRFVVALVPEAQPLISRYRLDTVEGIFRIYGNERVALVVSGIGKSAAAAATAYLHTKLGEPGGAVWFNAGIAGHRDRPIGESVLAEAITDQGSGRSWKLLVPEVAIPRASVLTTDRAEEAFETDCVYEMEAAGFYSTAIRFAHSELVQCFKVISDNRDSSTRHIRARDVEELIADRMDDLAAAVEATVELTALKDD